MRNIKVLTLSAAIASVLVSTTAIADLSGNIGFMSDYYFRGIQQSSGVASAGIDYENANGIYAGIWAADIGGHTTSGVGTANSGIETDYYAGYGGEINGISFSIGYTSYQYTGDAFDTAYNEINLTAGFGPISVEFSSGSQDSDGSPGSTDTDYTFIAVSGEYGPMSFTYGTWGDDTDGAYLEIGFAKEVSEIDFGVSLVNGDAADNAKNVASDGTALIFTIGKSFDL